MKNILNRASYLIIAVAILSIILAFFPVITVKSLYKIEPKVIEQGQSYTFEADYCKYLPLPATFYLVYVGELRHPTPNRYSSNREIGCHKDKFHIDIPDTLPPGKYFMQVIANYPPLLRSYTFNSEEFDVVAKEDKVQTILNILNSWEAVK